MVTVDLGSIVLAADRDTALEQLCAGPVVREATYLDGTPIYLVTGHDEIMTVLTDARFSNDMRNQAKLNVVTAVGLPEDLAPYFLAALGSQDAPDHTRLRRLVAKEFTFRRVERLKPRIQKITDDLLDALAERDEVDLIESLAYPLPINVICELLGVPLADQDRWRHWSSGMSTPDLDVFAASAAGLVDYILELIESKRREPGADLISALVADDELTTEELASLSLSILLAGHETTVAVLAGGVRLLLTHPEQMARLRADRPVSPAPSRSSSAMAVPRTSACSDSRWSR